MSKTIKTVPGKMYAVECANACTVTNSVTGVVACTTTAGAQGAFVATSGEYELSDDSAVVVPAQNFSVAPVTAQGGGGASVTVDNVFKATSTNAQSGKAVANAFSQYNLATNKADAIAIGYGAKVEGEMTDSIALGRGAKVLYADDVQAGNSIALGRDAKVLGGGTVCINLTIPGLTKNCSFYIWGPQSPLADKYTPGQAGMGYYQHQLNGTTRCGTNSFANLFPYNSEDSTLPFRPIGEE